MLLIGSLGVNYLVKEVLRKEKQKEWPALFGGLFYLFNLVTVQIFYTVYESFATHYGWLPWLILVAIRSWRKPSKKNLSWLVIVNILASPQAYVPTIFIVYILALFLVFLGQWIVRKRRKLLERFVKSLRLIVLVNLFWLLPFIWFVKENVKAPLESHNNQMATENLVLKSMKFGDIKNTVILRNFWFDYVELEIEGVDYLASSWRDHLSRDWVLGIGCGLFVVVLGGLVYGVYKKVFGWLSWVLMFVFSWLMLGSGVWGLAWWSRFWQEIPIVSQVIRMPFTKFGVMAALSYSLGFALGVWFIVSRRERLSKLCLSLLLIVMIVFVWPVFKGSLFDSSLRVKMPGEYFDLFKYFESKDDKTRIVNLPQPSYWGWTYYSWGYRGSGFLWYGIEQPIMDRTFDVWSSNNENYYWEVSRAIYSQNIQMMEVVLEKYQVSYLLFDKNVIGYGDYKSLGFEKINSMLQSSDKFQLEAKFGEIEVYKVRLDDQLNKFVKLESELTTVGPEYNWNDDDVAYKEYGDYEVSQDPEVYYPFRSLFTGRKQEELEFEVEEKDNQLIFKAVLPESLEGYSLVTSKLKGAEAKQVVQEPKVMIVDGKILVEILKDEGGLSYDSQASQEIVKAEKKSCNPFNTGEYEKQGKWTKGGETTWFRSVGSSNCVNINLPELSQNLGYLVQVDSRHIEGKSLLFYIINQMSQSRVIETELPKSEGSWSYIVPPMEEYGLGYSINFDNISIGKQETINELSRVKVYPIPYRFLKQIKLVKDIVRNDQKWQGSFEVKHPNSSYYEVSLDGEGKGTLVLSQSFDKGWVGYKERLFGERLDKQVLVNNWSNGFMISGDEQKIILWFWPQALEYLGFGGLIIALGIVLKSTDRQRHSRSN
jgi:hypothetical protein